MYDILRSSIKKRSIIMKFKLKGYNFEFKEVPAKELYNLMLNYHYLHRKVATKYAYGLYANNELKGMITYTVPRLSLAHSISEEANRDNTLELSRLYIKDEISQFVPNITSRFVSWTLRDLKKQGNWFIISFADTSMGHVGSIYQATNFLYTGTTKSGMLCYNGPFKQGGTWVKGVHYRFLLIRSIKHRYIKFVGDRQFQKWAKKGLKLDIVPHPHGIGAHYEVGDVETRFVKDRKTGHIYTEAQLLRSFPDYDWDNQDWGVDDINTLNK